MGSTSQFQMIQYLGKHGQYSFFKSVRVGDRILSVGTFMPVKIWPDSPTLSIADVQLLWSDKNESFCSLRLYFLPENTPDGRLSQHGEDEVIALQDRVVIRIPDLMSWLVDESEWDWGLRTPSLASTKPLTTPLSRSFVTESFKKPTKPADHNFDKISGTSSIVVLNYERYNRLRAVMKRLEGSSDLQNWSSHPLLLAIGGLNIGPNCRILYAKDVFDCPELDDHELLCNDLEPKLKLKGRPRGKSRSRNPSTGSLSNDSESSAHTSFSLEKVKKEAMNGINSSPKVEIDEEPTASPKVEKSKRSSFFDSSPIVSNSTNGVQVLQIDHLSKINEGTAGTKRSHSQANGASLSSESISKDGLRMTKTGTKGANGNGDFYDSYCTAELLGPVLTELAQKLEKSNALQILPIRSSVIKSSDTKDDADNQVRKKRAKTDFHGSDTANSTYHKSGPYASTTSVVGRPEVEKSSKGGIVGLKLTQAENMSNSFVKPSTQAHFSSQSSAKSAAKAQNRGKTLFMSGTSPCPFVPTNQLHGDPYEVKKGSPASTVSNSRFVEGDQILDFSSKRRPGFSVDQSDSNINFNAESELLDLSSKGQNHLQSSTQIYQKLAGIPPPNAMNQMGLRLTSEVTLFPSHSSLIPSKSKSPGAPQTYVNKMSSNHASSTVTKDKSRGGTSSQTWKQARGSVPGTSSEFLRTGDKESTASGSGYSHRKSTSANADRIAQPSQNSSKANVGSSRERKELEKANVGSSRERKELEKANAAAFNPYLHPSFYGKVDPAYLSLLGAPQLFLPPNAGIVNIPPAMEQFYKELFMQGQQGMPSSFPGWFQQPPGKDHGPKS